MIPWKLFWTALGCVASLTAAGVPILLGLNPLLIVAGLIPAAALVAAGARMGVKFSVLLVGLKDPDRDSIAGLIMLAVAVHAVWIALFVLFPGWWTWWPLVLLAMSGAELLGAWAYEKSMEHRKPEPDRTVDGTPLGDREQVFSEALRRAGLGRLAIVRSEELRELNDQ